MTICQFAHLVSLNSFLFFAHQPVLKKCSISFSVGLPRMACVFVCGVSILDDISCHFNPVTPSQQNGNAILTRLSVKNIINFSHQLQTNSVLIVITPEIMLL